MGEAAFVSRETTQLLAVCKSFVSGFGTKPPLTEAFRYAFPQAFCSLHHDGEPYGIGFTELIDQETMRLAKMYDSGMKSYEHALTDSNQTVWVCENIAAVVSGYVVRVDGVDTHHGVSLFSLCLLEGKQWMIAGLAETRWAAKSAIPPILSEPPTEAMALVDSFFYDLTHQKWDSFSSLLLDGGGVTLSRRPQPPLSMAWPDFVAWLQKIAASMPPGTVIDEKIHDWEVRCCGDMMVLWTPYFVDVNGKRRSKGQNLITLFKRKGEWTIAGCQDTQSV